MRKVAKIIIRKNIMGAAMSVLDKKVREKLL